MSHTEFTKVSWMIFVKVDSVVMLTSSKTTSSSVTTLSVLSDTTLTVRYVTSVLSGFLVSSHHADSI